MFARMRTVLVFLSFRRHTALAILLVAAVVGLLLIAPGAASAGPMSYFFSTSGNIADSGDGGGGFINFRGAGVSSLFGPTSLNLGGFEVRPLPAGSSITYENLPFRIDMSIWPQGARPGDMITVSIKGVINGTITDTRGSSLTASLSPLSPWVASINQKATLPFLLSDLKINLPILLAPSSVNGGKSQVTAYLSSPMPIPEPATIALFGATFGLVALRSRSRRRRGGPGVGTA
jgi:hypothetical protein